MTRRRRFGSEEAFTSTMEEERVETRDETIVHVFMNGSIYMTSFTQKNRDDCVCDYDLHNIISSSPTQIIFNAFVSAPHYRNLNNGQLNSFYNLDHLENLYTLTYSTF